MSNLQVNKYQQEAIHTLEGPLLLLAGAGSGKTTVIIHRMVNLIKHGVDPKHILAVTFTNKAAKEMRERMAAILGKETAKYLTISTFHSFCVRILRRNIQVLGFSKNFSIATDNYRSGLMREIMTEKQMIGSGYDPSGWLYIIGLAKANLEGPEDLKKKQIGYAEEIAIAYRRYQERMKQMDMIDFDDMLTLTVKLLQENPNILEGYQKKYTYLTIDEYQDTNTAQLRLMVLLAGDQHNIAVVGDDDQSIYGWRGANIKNILDFESYFPGAKVIRLEQNYRSSNTILKAANALIGKNSARREKNLWSEQGEGEKIKLICCRTSTEEADFVAKYVRDICANKNWSDVAVLFRSNMQARLLEEKFRKARVPYILIGTDSFYQTKEVMDSLSFLQAVQNPENDLDFLRIVNTPTRGIGDTTIEHLRNYRDITKNNIQEIASSPVVLNELPPESAKSLTNFMKILTKYRRIFAEPGQLYRKVSEYYGELKYMESMGRMYKPRENALKRRDNVLEFLNTLQEFENHNPGNCTLQQYLDLFTLRDAMDKQEKGKDTQENAVTLMTIHASKGLEFKQVVIVGLEQGIFPHERALQEGNEEEERRLCYVAITRAKQQLILTYSQKRRLKGRVKIMIPSKFLNEIPDKYMELLKPENVFKPVEQNKIHDFLNMLKNDND
ncbi:MAG: UvrD-helicase domain-containing protein [Lentisphaeria bacterium]